MSPTDFAALLLAEQWQLVYSFANICEVAVINELLETRRRLQILESIPHTYIIGLPRIQCREFEAAVEAFENGHEQNRINPFVRHWYLTYTYPGQPNYQDMLLNYTLVDQVLPIVVRNPDVCRNLPQHTLLMQQSVDEDRAVTNAVRRNRARFEGRVHQALNKCRLQVPSAGLTEFARWVRADQLRCPGWRIFNEAYLEFCSNVQDQVEGGDIPDFSHISCLPYVEAITLDRRMAGYARTAALKLNRENPSNTYAECIFSNTEAWLQGI
jgi:hypothetical protein